MLQNLGTGNGYLFSKPNSQQIVNSKQKKISNHGRQWLQQQWWQSQCPTNKASLWKNTKRKTDAHWPPVALLHSRWGKRFKSFLEVPQEKLQEVQGAGSHNSWWRSQGCIPLKQSQPHLWYNKNSGQAERAGSGGQSCAKPWSANQANSLPDGHGSWRHCRACCQDPQCQLDTSDQLPTKERELFFKTFNKLNGENQKSVWPICIAGLKTLILLSSFTLWLSFWKFHQINSGSAEAAIKIPYSLIVFISAIGSVAEWVAFIL